MVETSIAIYDVYIDERINPVTGHRPFSELTKNFTPARRARVAAKAAALSETMTLGELRKARSLSQ
jgi:small neutral amino acid transporter SnatA (MarC family)